MLGKIKLRIMVNYSVNKDENSILSALKKISITMTKLKVKLMKKFKPGTHKKKKY